MTDNPDELSDKIHMVYEDPQFTSRSRAAAALRRLGNAFVRHRFSDNELISLAEWATSTAQNLEHSDPVSRPSDYFERRYSDPRPVDGAEVIAFSDRTFSGPANPMGVEVEIRRDGDRVVSRVVFGAAFESAPGRTHGGAVSALVDDTMGYLMIVLGEAAYTARLEVDYRGGVPIDVPVWFQAWVSSRDGRKLVVDLTVSPDKDGMPDRSADPLITAEGLFIIPSPSSS
jgi:acyl-coenzyme A thioesterase PaaI-like protein